MQPIDLSQSNNLGFRANFSISSPSKYSKMSLSKMSSASLIYKKKMDRLMHSIKVQCVCDKDCACNKRYGESILEEEDANNIYGVFHRDWEEFVGSIVHFT